MRSSSVRRITKTGNELDILREVSSLPIREDQAGMTPEQRVIINEIMEKVFAILKEEGRTLKDG